MNSMYVREINSEITVNSRKNNKFLVNSRKHNEFRVNLGRKYIFAKKIMYSKLIRDR